MNSIMIRREDVAQILKAWQANKMSSREVYDWANSVYPCNYEAEDWEGANDDSVTNEVLAALDTLDMNLALPEDAPIYLDFLTTPKGEFAAGYTVFQKRLKAIDYRAREEKLKDDPLYAPFLKHVSR